MRIALTAQGRGLDSALDRRFGRASVFLLVDCESMAVEAFPNPGLDATRGAGIQVAQFLAERQVEAVVTGQIGPNALQTLQAAGIAVYTTDAATASDAVHQFLKGVLAPAAATGGPGLHRRGGGAR